MAEPEPKPETDLDDAFSKAVGCAWWEDTGVCDNTVGTLAGLVSIWRGRACYWHGKATGQAETIAELKSRVEWLEDKVESLS